MGERTGSLERSEFSVNGSETAVSTPRDTARRLGSEIAALRDDLDHLVREVDRRRHETLDLGLQVRRHTPGAVVTIVALIGAAAGFAWVGSWRARRRNRLMSQPDRLRQVLSRMIDHPERVAAERPLPEKIMTAAANAAVAVIIKRILERAVVRLLDGQRRDADTPAAIVEERPAAA
jgi:hypothetical protein